MSSPPRFHEPGYRHFITFNTYKRRQYLAPEHTRDIVIQVLQKVLDAHRCACSGFVIMPDHVHAIVFGQDDGNFAVSPFVQVWKKTSSYRIRQFYKKEFPSYEAASPDTPAIWQPGFHDVLVDDTEHNTKLEYMHQNPVTARLADVSVSWTCSSARFYELGEPCGVTITV